MQTFLPLPSFVESAKVLDFRRLGKQRVEAWQILRAILNPGPGPVAWINHPATKMWKPYPGSLCLYGIRICEEWISRGYKDSLLARFNVEYSKFTKEQIKIPAFITDERFNSSHRASLLFKNHKYYSQFGWSERPNMDYFWPI